MEFSQNGRLFLTLKEELLFLNCVKMSIYWLTCKEMIDDSL